MGIYTGGPPPERTGDQKADLDRLYNWCGQLAAYISRQNNYMGILKKGTTGEEGENAD